MGAQGRLSVDKTTSVSYLPVALVEVGFMTNRQELDNLANADYQKQAAQGIYNAIMQAFDEGY